LTGTSQAHRHHKVFRSLSRFCPFRLLEREDVAVHLLPIEISTPRLVLRQWSDDDVDHLAGAIRTSLEHLQPWMPWVAMEPLSRVRRLDMIRQWRNDQAAGGDSVFGVFVGDVIVGGCGLHRRGGPGELEIGYWVHSDHLRLGYATEIAGALTGAAFDQPEVDAVVIHHDKANAVSGRVPERLSYELIAEHPSDIAAPSDSGISCHWQITRATWSGSH
jgi:ribosomal-protein-serine acetyltransferase